MQPDQVIGPKCFMPELQRCSLSRIPFVYFKFYIWEKVSVTTDMLEVEYRIL